MVGSNGKEKIRDMKLLIKHTLSHAKLDNASAQNQPERYDNVLLYMRNRS